MLATKDVLRTLLRGIMQCIRRLGLPEVTAAENGRILKVVRGAWAAVQPDPITAADLPETVPVPASVGQAGQVLTVQADGTTGYAWPQLMDGTLTPGYAATSSAQVFVIDVARPQLGRFTLPSLLTMVRIKNLSTGETIAEIIVGTPSEINVRGGGPKDVLFFCTSSNGGIDRYDYLLEDMNDYKAGWVSRKTIYTKGDVDTLLAAKLDAPSAASVGQTLRVTAVDSAGKPTAWQTVDPWVIQSSNEGSTKQFRLTVDDSGVISLNEVTATES